MDLTGIEYRQHLEDRLGRLTVVPWQHLGAELTDRFIELIELVGMRLMARVDAGDASALVAGSAVSWIDAERSEDVEPLVSTQWLGEHLDDDDLVVIDATVTFDSGAFHSGRKSWEASHIPGSVFAELLTDLSDPDAPVPLMAPSAERFAAAVGRLGISNGTRVVVYDSRASMWAARLWWMLRAFGHDECAVLDGGMTSWVAENRPVSNEVTPVEPATFVPDPRPGRFVAKENVLRAIDDDGNQLVDALSEEQYLGEVTHYGRAGHIPGAINVPATGIVDSGTQRYLSNDELRERFEPALRSDSVITYCGGGVAASSDALALTLLGHDNVAVYDGSMLEWAADPELPLET